MHGFLKVFNRLIFVVMALVEPADNSTTIATTENGHLTRAVALTESNFFAS